MKRGSTFLLYDDDDYDPSAVPHLHVVITDPNEADRVLVSITKQRARSDTMTSLAVRDHPFIRVPSVVTVRLFEGTAL